MVWHINIFEVNFLSKEVGEVVRLFIIFFFTYIIIEPGIEIHYLRLSENTTLYIMFLQFTLIILWVIPSCWRIKNLAWLAYFWLWCPVYAIFWCFIHYSSYSFLCNFTLTLSVSGCQWGILLRSLVHHFFIIINSIFHSQIRFLYLSFLQGTLSSSYLKLQLCSRILLI